MRKILLTSDKDDQIVIENGDESLKKSLIIILNERNYIKNLLKLYWNGVKNACVLILIGSYFLPRPSIEQILVTFTGLGVFLILISLVTIIYYGK